MNKMKFTEVTAGDLASRGEHPPPEGRLLWGKLQIPYAPPELRFGMTKGELSFSGRVATRLDGVESGYSVNTADSTPLLRSSGRDDKERVVTYLGSCDWDVWIPGRRVV